MSDHDDTAIGDDLRTEEEVASTAQDDQTVTLEALGQDIVARVERGNRSRAHADDLFKSAGIQLIEAKKRAPDFKAFPSRPLQRHQPQSRLRADRDRRGQGG